MNPPYEQYCAVPAAGSKHFKHRVYKTKAGEDIPNSFLSVRIRKGTPKAEIIKHLDLIRDWLIAGEDIQQVHPDTFYLELEAIPKLKVVGMDNRRPKRWKARFPKGEPSLI